MRNKYPGTCYRCGKRVEKGEGHFEKISGSRPAKWRVQHAECAIEHRGHKYGYGETRSEREEA